MDATGLDIEALKKAVQDEANRMERNHGKHGKEGEPRTEKVLGGMFELSPALASAVNVTVNWLQPVARRWVEGGIRASATPMLTKVGMQAETAQKTADILADSAGWALTFYNEAGGLVGHTKQHVKDLSQLKQRFSKVNVAMGGKANSLDALKGNELVEVELSRVTSKWRTNLMSTATGLIASAPQAIIKWQDGKKDKGKRGIAQIQGESNDQYLERYLKALEKEAAQAEKIEDALHEKLEPLKEKIRSRNLPAYEQREAIRNLENRVRSQMQAESDHKAIDEKTISELLVPLGALGSVVVRDGLLKSHEAKDNLKTTAFDMIEKLSDVVINDPDAKTVSGLNFAAYIKNIFNTHQENMGQPRIGKRYEEKLDYACREIAAAITEGKMHPMALANLVGDRKIVKDKGKHIASREEVEQAIGDQMQRMPAKFSVDAEEYIAEAAVSEDDIKHALEGLKDKDRAFFISLLPEEVAKKVGLKETEIKAAHDVAKEGFAEHLSQAVLDVATLSDEKLKEARLSEKEIAMIREIAPKAKAGQTEELLSHVSKKGDFKDTADYVIASMMAEGVVNSPGALYEQAEHKLYGEHEHPHGTYAENDEKKRPAVGQGFGKSPKHEDAAESVTSHHTSWDKGDEIPDSHIQHANHEGIHQARERHVN